MTVDAEGTDEQLGQIHQEVMEISPNYANFAKPIRMIPTLEIVH